jgi:YVTN family beta-propeller protein
MPGLENSDELAAIDTAGNTVVATVPVGQAPQAIAYVSNAVPRPRHRQSPAARHGRQGVASDYGADGGKGAASSITLFDQGIIQVVQSAVTGLQPKKPTCSC